MNNAPSSSPGFTCAHLKANPALFSAPAINLVESGGFFGSMELSSMPRLAAFPNIVDPPPEAHHGT
jgi:hypothetical protein